ncbi:MAG: transglutaminase domain-containing protein [Clostridiales bacterium]|nr:transglutaminase domain-containing protein [Clostridiales bacterium]
MKERPTTGIYFSGGIKLQSTAKKSGGNGSIYLRCVYLFFCLAGTLMTVKEAFGLDIRMGGLLGMMAAGCLLSGFVYVKGGRWKFLLYGWNGAVFLSGVYCWERVVSGYLAVENGVRNQLSSYYRMNLARRKIPLAEEQGELFLLLIFTLLIGVLGGIVVKKGRIAFLTLIQILIFSLELLCGCTFQGVGIYLIVCSLLALLSMENQRGGRNQRILCRTGIWAGGMLLILMLVSALLVSPVLFQNAEEWNQKLYRTMQQTTAKISGAIQSQNGIFGNHAPTADGSLNNYGVDQDEETDLRVTVSERPEQMMYLRGFIGDTYEGTYWHRIDREAFEQNFPWEDGEYQVQNILYRYIKSQTGDPEGTVTVEKVRRIGDYGYVPYGFATPNDNNLEGDSYYSSAEDKMEYTGYVNWKNWVGSGAAQQAESEIEAAYREYAADQYLKIPVNGLERLKEYCAGQDFRTVQEVIDFVVPTVKEGRPYSMDLEPVPEGEDFAEYFFFEQKKGYCIHYATTAVLMFRMMGVPARYATGYVVAPDAFSESANGYTAEVPDSQAHAWVEVYRAGKGWIPVEVTPGYEGGFGESQPEEMANDIAEETSQSTPQPTPEQPETGTAEPTPAGTENQTEEDTADENESGPPEKGENEEKSSSGVLKAAAGILLAILAVAAAVLLCVGILLANRKRALGRRRRKFLQKDRNKAVCEISYGLYQMLWDAGIQENDTKDIPYARKMEEKLGILKEGEYVTFIRLVQQAAYGPGQLTEEEHRACLGFYHRIAAYLWQQMTKRKKFRWKYMKCYEIS